MDADTFEQLVAEGFDQLPQWVRDKISNAALLIEDEPSPQLRQQEHLRDNQTLLGHYRGVPLAARGSSYGIGMIMPDTITLFRLPIIKNAADTNADVRDVIADTIWHEFAHHFGMNEAQVRAREAQKGIGSHRAPSKHNSITE